MSLTIVLVSADVEWSAVRARFPTAELQRSPYGEWFYAGIQPSGREPQVAGLMTTAAAQATMIFFQGGWGKIAAAGSTQYAIDRWSPELLINLGTCGGFEGAIERDEIVLVDRTIVYDIYEQMGDPVEHIAHYTTSIDLSWLDGPLILPVRQTGLISGDRDLVESELPALQAQYGALAGDWESGAIAWVAARNHTRVLILRGVTDLVGVSGGEAYGNLAFFAENARKLMDRLIDSLPGWLALAGR
jgi:adenosylhomocysteine nucleosidase